MFKLLIETYDLTADNTVFIDDKLANVEAAEDSGIYGIHFQNAALLRRDLLKLKLL